jgi:hypothetical protein
MEAELEAYEYQLSQVKLGLESDPGNVELTSLQAELEEIIDLTKQAIGGPVGGGAGGAGSGEASTSTSKGNKKNKDKGFKAGEEVSARYKDMKWSVRVLLPFSPGQPQTSRIDIHTNSIRSDSTRPYQVPSTNNSHLRPLRFPLLHPHLQRLYNPHHPPFIMPQTHLRITYRFPPLCSTPRPRFYPGRIQEETLGGRGRKGEGETEEEE